MNIKKIFTKIIATILSVATLCNILPVYAIYDCLNISRWLRDLHLPAAELNNPDNPWINERLSYEICEFNNLPDRGCRVTFELADELYQETPSRYRHYRCSVYPLCLLIFLSVINNFFTTHPYTKLAFINMIKERGGNKFILTTIDPEEDSTCIAHYDCACNPEIAMSTRHFESFEGDERPFSGIWESFVRHHISRAPIIEPNYKDPFEMIALTAYHELGHLIEDIYTFYYLKYALDRTTGGIITKLCKYAQRATDDDRSLSSATWYFLYPDMSPPPDIRADIERLSEMYETAEQTLNSCIKQRIEKSSGITKSVSKRVDKLSAEFFAEAYCRSRFTYDADPLKIEVDKVVEGLEAFAQFGDINYLDPSIMPNSDWIYSYIRK